MIQVGGYIYTYRFQIMFYLIIYGPIVSYIVIYRLILHFPISLVFDITCTSDISIIESDIMYLQIVSG